MVNDDDEGGGGGNDYDEDDSDEGGGGHHQVVMMLVTKAFASTAQRIYDDIDLKRTQFNIKMYFHIAQ